MRDSVMPLYTNLCKKVQFQAQYLHIFKQNFILWHQERFMTNLIFAYTTQL